MVSFVGLAACAASASPPVPSLSPARLAEQAEEAAPTPAPAEATSNTASTDVPTQGAVLDGVLSQGGLIRGRTATENTVLLDEQEILVDEGGNFLFGFDRDHPATAELVIVSPDGSRESETLTIAEQEWRESRITVPENKANPSAQYDLDKIAEDKELKAKARENMSDVAYWLSDFEWPVEGCISSHFGFQRIINGEPRRYHSGVDVAAPDGMSPIDYIGTPVYAPTDGIVTLAEADMFFEGGLVLIDHGQTLESALMHLSEVNIEAGETVSKGDLVGKIGMEGRVTGPHLHWTLKWRDRPLDPTFVVAERPNCTPGL